MKIIQYADELNPNSILEEKIMKRDFICPYCKIRNNITKFHNWHRFFNSEEARLNDANTYVSDLPIKWSKKSWYGYKDHKFHLFSKEKKQRWNKFICHCTKCNTKWEGDPYPTIKIKENCG